jgi:hypothetical protein
LSSPDFEEESAGPSTSGYGTRNASSSQTTSSSGRPIRKRARISSGEEHEQNGTSGPSFYKSLVQSEESEDDYKPVPRRAALKTITEQSGSDTEVDGDEEKVNGRESDATVMAEEDDDGSSFVPITKRRPTNKRKAVTNGSGKSKKKVKIELESLDGSDAPFSDEMQSSGTEAEEEEEASVVSEELGVDDDDQSDYDDRRPKRRTAAPSRFRADNSKPRNTRGARNSSSKVANYRDSDGSDFDYGPKKAVTTSSRGRLIKPKGHPRAQTTC